MIVNIYLVTICSIYSLALFCCYCTYNIVVLFYRLTKHLLTTLSISIKCYLVSYCPVLCIFKIYYIF
ncbi:hypothetical protein BD408DRAFT_136868 [Parasitella parasitica]|nr:hypothetical protein BD408DRAFT_136868 [Parasitella parasitica]